MIELLSDSTAQSDKNEKKLIYQNQLRVPEYFWFDPFNPDDWAGFFLQHGVYQPISPTAQERLVSQSLGLALLRWQGNYKGTDATWLRWATSEGELLPLRIKLPSKNDSELIRSNNEQTKQSLSCNRQHATYFRKG